MYKDYISVNEACNLLGTTRQNIFYLKRRNIIKDFIQVHATCILYNREELLTLKSQGYGN